MFPIRHFKNSDVPALAEIWNSQPAQRGVMQPVSANVLDVCVLSSQCFDPEGLIIATQDGRPIGFAHAGFGPCELGQRLDFGAGVTQLLMVHGEFKDNQRNEVADSLLQASEDYLRSRGANVLYGGGIKPLDPFYHGLYGGSEMSGVLESNRWLTEVFGRNQYQVANEIVVLHRDLSTFRPGFSREGRQLRREVEIRCDAPVAEKWWDACQQCEQERMRYELVQKRGDEVLGSTTFWEIEPLATSWGIRTVGLVELEIDSGHRRRGLATYLLTEAFQKFRHQGVSMVEVQTMVDNQPALALYQSLGFIQVDTGRVWRRAAS